MALERGRASRGFCCNAAMRRPLPKCFPPPITTLAALLVLGCQSARSSRQIHAIMVKTTRFSPCLQRAQSSASFAAPCIPRSITRCCAKKIVQVYVASSFAEATYVLHMGFLSPSAQFHPQKNSLQP